MKFLPIMNDVFDDLFYDSFKNYSNVNAMRTDICEQNDQYLLNMEPLINKIIIFLSFNRFLIINSFTLYYKFNYTIN